MLYQYYKYILGESMKHDKQKNKVEDKNKKTYHTLHNMAYVMKGIYKWQRILIPMLIVYSFTQASMSFIWVFISKFVIEEIQLNNGIYALFRVVLIATVIQLLFMGVNTYINHQTWWKFIFIRMKFITLKMKKALTMNYEHLEDPKILDYMEKAGQATGGNTNGVEGMMHSCMNTMVNIVKIAASGAIMFTLSPWIVLAMFFLSFLHFIIIDQTKKMDKIKTWDALAPNWRKINYMDQITKNFDFAKDIRLFGLSEWLNKKQIHYHGEAHEKIVESKIRWIKCGLLNQIIGFIQEGLLYAWLIYLS